MTEPMAAPALKTAVWFAPAVLSAAGRRAFTDLLPYCFPPGCAYDVSPGPKPIVSYAAGEDADTARIEQLLAAAYQRSSGIDGQATTVADRWAEVGGAGVAPADVRLVGPGLYVGGPGIALLTRALDRVFLDVAHRAGALEYAVPGLVSWETLDRAQYTKNFPQHLFACATVGPDLDAIERFAASADSAVRSAELVPGEVFLAPAVCLHLFARFAGSVLAQPQAGTVRGSCGRYEAASRASPVRLWSYSMREIVFIGPAAPALAFHGQMLDVLAGLLDDLAVPGRVVTASDPFFTSAAGARTDYQNRFAVKHELCGRMAPDGASLAVASLNLHQQHFGIGFDIKLADGSPAHSVCIGFGLERWAHWLHGYLGDDPARWPALLRDSL
ncbi:MAG TPA: hypothetical protein VNF47_23345 [Streptosporangiaceae bacterium]|nr:hypothetical protein [Streptosporangiaceae bacterium]